MSKVSHESEEITAKFSEFFPPNDPDSTWLFRLMLLRDDVDYNRGKLQVKEDAGPEEVWELTYHLKMLSVALVEVNSIFGHELGKFAKRPPNDVAKRMAPLLQSGMAKLEAVVGPLKTLRDAIGGHVRPQNVDKQGPDVVSRVIANHPLLAGTVRIGGLPETVSYRSLTLNSMAFAWPDVDGNDKIEAKQAELQQAIFAGAEAAVLTIDGLLGYFWFNLGVYKAGPNRDFAIRDLRNQELYHPVQKPDGRK